MPTGWRFNPPRTLVQTAPRSPSSLKAVWKVSTPSTLQMAPDETCSQSAEGPAVTVNTEILGPL